jgi:hypothetical protein
MLYYEDGKLRLIGEKTVRIFKYNQPVKELLLPVIWIL